MTKRILSIILLLILSYQIHYAQTADEIVKKTLEVQGNEKLKNLKTLKIFGKLTTSENSADFKIYFKYPNSIRSEMTYNNQTMTQSFDGNTAWYIDPNDKDKKPQKLPEDALGELKNQKNMLESPLAGYQKKGIKIKMLGKKKTDNIEAYKLKLTLKDKSELMVYIDTKTNLMYKTWTELKKDKQKAVVETYMKNYKAVEGAMLPHLIETFVNSKKYSSMTMDKIEANSNIDDSFFKMPKK